MDHLLLQVPDIHDVQPACRQPAPVRAGADECIPGFRSQVGHFLESWRGVNIDPVCGSQRKALVSLQPGEIIDAPFAEAEYFAKGRDISGGEGIFGQFRSR